MKVKTLLEYLSTQDPEGRVFLGSAEGHGEKEFLCCFSFVDNSDVVLSTEDDFDVKEELTSMLGEFIKEGVDELDAYQDMLDLGYTPDILRKNDLAGEADAMEVFCREHGMLG